MEIPTIPSSIHKENIEKILDFYQARIELIKQLAADTKRYRHVLAINDEMGIDSSLGIYTVMAHPDGCIEIFNLKGSRIKSIFKIPAEILEEEFLGEAIRKVNEQMIEDLVIAARRDGIKHWAELQRDDIGLTGFHIFERYVVAYPNGRHLLLLDPPIES